MRFVNRLTREIEDHLPAFGSHGEAAAFFREKFGVDFTDVLQRMDGKDEAWYLHHLIVHRDLYELGQRDLAAAVRDGRVKLTPDGVPLLAPLVFDADEYMLSYHPIEISESGKVYITY